MAEYKMVEVEEKPYLYNERACSMNPDDVSHNMEIAFRTVAEFIDRNGIASMGKALSAYYTYDEEIMTFRAGFLVSAEDAQKAEGDVKADVLPAGRVLNFIHRGSYTTLRDSYGDMMRYLEANGIAVGAPTWELYLNNPDSVASEDDLQTDIYVTVET